jgi:tetratricopeptide (TPR) repeat protein
MDYTQVSYDEYNYKIAFDEFKKSAKQGNAFCQYQVALMYEFNRHYDNLGTWSDFDKAIKYYKKAADQGLAIAQIKLGSIYFYEIKYSKAFEYFEKAASQENPHAQLMLGHMFEHGKGIMKNFEKAFEYYEKAASQDQIGALMHLGRIYENGIETEIDSKKAFEYYKKAADNNYPDANFKLHEMYKNGIGTEIDLEKSEVYEKKGNYLEQPDFFIYGNEPCPSNEEDDFIFEIGNERKKLINKRNDEDYIQFCIKYFPQPKHIDKSSKNVQSIARKHHLDDMTEISSSPAKKSR